MQSRISKLALLLSTAGLFTGCAVGPNYHRPEVNAPEKFRSQKDASPESLASLPWWKVFKDPVLQDLIREGLENNYDLRIAITRIEQARARTIQARSEFFPQLGYNAGASRTQNPGATVPASSTPDISFDMGGVPVTIPGTTTPEHDIGGTRVNQFSANGLLSWELDLWGRIRRSNESALAQLLATEEAQKGVTQSLVAQIAQIYFQLRSYDAELAISRETVASFRQTLDLFEKQQAGGIASDLEVARGTASLAGAEASIPRLEAQITVTENQLSTLIGRNPGPIKRGRSLTEQALPPRVPSGIPSELLERRPDLRQAELQMVSANAQVGVAIANFLPRIDLTAGAGIVSPALSQFGNGNGNIWNLAGTISGPIFQGGRLVGVYKETEAYWRETVLTYERTALNAFSEVSNALISREKYGQMAVQLARQVDALQQSVRLSSDRYTIGISTYYEVLEAQQQLYPAQVQLVQTRLAQLQAVVDLYKALGGGWDERVGKRKKEETTVVVTRIEKSEGRAARPVVKRSERSAGRPPGH